MSVNVIRDLADVQEEIIPVLAERLRCRVAQKRDIREQSVRLLNEGKEMTVKEESNRYIIYLYAYIHLRCIVRSEP
jgi:hypothetical protein